MSANSTIPFLDLVTPHRELAKELVSVFETVLATGGFVGGPMVEDFEREFAQACGASECVGVGSGTDALRFALMAAGVRAGDTVVTVPNTFIATTEAISQAGARPSFVDVDERTYNMDPHKLQAFLEDECHRDPTNGKWIHHKTQRPVTAVVPVHLYGQMAEMDAILELAERYRLLVIEDACQAHGAMYYSNRMKRWKSAGSMGDAAAFSFYPGKNLGACGEAGAVTTNRKDLAGKVRMLRDHGQVRKYQHEMEGYNGRLDAIQAGILRAKLRRLPLWNRKRRACARRYDELFRTCADAVTTPYKRPGGLHGFHLYVIRVRNRDDLLSRLAQAGITTQIHYPVPLHLQPACAALGYREGDFPVAEKVAAEILSLPMYPHLKRSQQRCVAEAVKELLEARAASGTRALRAAPAAS